MEAGQSCFPFCKGLLTAMKTIDHTRVNNGMTLERDSGYELLVTDVASEWLYSSMSPHVRLQLELCTECLVTLITFEGFVSSMYGLRKQKKPALSMLLLTLLAVTLTKCLSAALCNLPQPIHVIGRHS